MPQATAGLTSPATLLLQAQYPILHMTQTASSYSQKAVFSFSWSACGQTHTLTYVLAKIPHSDFYHSKQLSSLTMPNLEAKELLQSTLKQGQNLLLFWCSSSTLSSVVMAFSQVNPKVLRKAGCSLDTASLPTNLHATWPRLIPSHKQPAP